ncbi:uncharacterized protein LOC143871329 [Tasmannia lanceolata]|uniref:uncharacterized protein LOC143871329 n=1 Tax=Tasmannia lanceolata TaxID=3420 RepID=UPI004063BC78
MASKAPKWDGLLKWSLAHSEGTGPPRNLSEEDRKWFVEAMEDQTVDVIKRMKEITQVMQTPMQVLEAQGVTSGDLEDMLDELQEHVESIDMANALHSIGGLDPLIGYLKNSYAGIRAKAAEILVTVVQNNPRSQQLVMEANGLETLLSNLISDPDATVRTKALGALSSLIRHNKPGVAAFCLANGYEAVRDALGSKNASLQRRALNLIQYLLQENSSDCRVVTELGFPHIMMHLASSDDAEVRQAALECLLEISRDKAAGIRSLAQEGEKLKKILQDRIDSISSMAPEDLEAAHEERQLVESIWNTCFNEPSSLGEKGTVEGLALCTEIPITMKGPQVWEFKIYSKNERDHGRRDHLKLHCEAYNRTE